jgi:hypothetical protein
MLPISAVVWYSRLKEPVVRRKHRHGVSGGEWHSCYRPATAVPFTHGAALFFLTQATVVAQTVYRGCSVVSIT